VVVAARRGGRGRGRRVCDRAAARPRGHLPALGLSTGTTQPIALPGVVLAGLATIGLGLVLGPEAPLITLGGGLGLLAARLVSGNATAELGELLAASATFAALSLIFASPIVAAVILIEASGLGGARLPVVLLPGLLAAGIGSLISVAWDRGRG
jgi:H+/Cl- antiporter ClcA